MSFVAGSIFLHYITLALAVLTPHLGISSRKRDSCHELARPYDEICWQTGSLSGDLTTQNQVMPTCTRTKASNCYRLDEPWSTCFRRLFGGAADKDCHVIGTGQACTFDRYPVVGISIHPPPSPSLNQGFSGAKKQITLPDQSSEATFALQTYNLTTAMKAR